MDNALVNAIPLECKTVNSKVNGTISSDEKVDALYARDSLTEVDNDGSQPPKPSGKQTFSTKIGAFIACCGSSVGTGNVWRFPKEVANASDADGALAFYGAWILLLFFWSIPLVVLEQTLGRFTKGTPVLVFAKFWGKRYIWVGFCFFVVIFFIGGYYQVVVGWCFYYLYLSISLPSLPTTGEEGEALFRQFAEESYWPLLTQLLVIILAGLVIIGGIRAIEVANIIFVPILWVILFSMFGWSLTRPYAEIGIAFLFTPVWSSFLRPAVWMKAIGQNCFDTSAGMGIQLSYASRMTRDTAIVRNSVLIPMLNNFCSLFTSIAIYSTVFSIIISINPTVTRSDIIDMLRQAGPKGTGVTFTWIPVLLGEIGVFGRAICFLFFLGLSVAGLLSFISSIQAAAMIIVELGLPEKLAIIGTVIFSALVGMASSLDANILANQDLTWAYFLVILGFLLSVLVITYGPFRYFRVIVNDFGINDWKVPKFLIPFFSALVPIEAATLIIYWIYGAVTTDPDWNMITMKSISTVFLEWGVAIVVVIVVNILIVKCWKNALSDAMKEGWHPHDPNIDLLLYGEERGIQRLFPLKEKAKRSKNKASRGTIIEL